MPHTYNLVHEATQATSNLEVPPISRTPLNVLFLSTLNLSDHFQQRVHLLHPNQAAPSM